MSLKNNPKVSIVVPVFNVEKYLNRCVDSITKQSYKNLEIILVDDGSKDASGTICDELQLSDSRIVVVHKENGGLSSARNTGLDVFTGDFVGFVDSDDFIEQNMIEELLAANLENDSLIACCGRFDLFDNNKKVVGLCPSENIVIDKTEGIKRLLTWDGLDASACDKLFSKCVWKDMRFPNGKISEDVAVMHLLFEKAERISLINAPLYNYCHRQSSITSTSFSTKKFDIISNVDEIGLFIKNKYPSLLPYYHSFKIEELCLLLSYISKSNYKNKTKIKSICEQIRDSKKNTMRHLSFKKNIRQFVFSHYFCFCLFRLFRKKSVIDKE